MADRLLLFGSLTVSAVPALSFTAALLVALFSVRLHWLPALALVDPHRPVIGQPRLLVLPAAALTLSTFAYVTRLVRASVLDAAATPWALAARLRGVPRFRVVTRHILPAALPVVCQAAALTSIALVTSVVVVEIVFSYPGIGGTADRRLPAGRPRHPGGDRRRGSLRRHGERGRGRRHAPTRPPGPAAPMSAPASSPSARMSRASRMDLVLGLVMTAPPVLATLVGGFVRPYSTTASVGPPLAGPSTAHLLGTDALGRDLLSRLLVGGRGLLLVTLLAVLAAQVVAVAFGVLAGWLGRYGARALLGILDVVLAIPAVVVLAAAASALGAGGPAVFVAIVVVLVPSTARVVYVATRALVAEPFVEAALLGGTPTRRILTRELLPNLWTIIVAGTGSRVVESVFVISSAGFLGFGPQPPTPDWGRDDQ